MGKIYDANTIANLNQYDVVFEHQADGITLTIPPGTTVLVLNEDAASVISNTYAEEDKPTFTLTSAAILRNAIYDKALFDILAEQFGAKVKEVVANVSQEVIDAAPEEIRQELQKIRDGAKEVGE